MTVPITPELLQRSDNSDDARFYSEPRLVKHIDEPACAALTSFLCGILPANAEILDLMSSCASHLPPELSYRSVVGLGMNEIELQANQQLSSYLTHDLAINPKIPFPDNSFDACTVTVSVQYLVHPISVFREIGRVLRPNGPCVVSFSNRCFPTKAVTIWLQLNNDGHTQLVAQYFNSSKAFSGSWSVDISPNPGWTDPLITVCARAV